MHQIVCRLGLCPRPTGDRPVADGTVHCAGSATYQICFRLPIPNPSPNPNPKNNKKRKRHQNKIEHRVISKSRFPRDWGGFVIRPITGNGTQTHMDGPESRLLAVLHWGSLHRSPRPPSWFRGGAHGEREGGRGGEKEGGEGGEGRGGPPGMPKSRVGKPRTSF